MIFWNSQRLSLANDIVIILYMLLSVDVLLKPAGDAPILKKKKWAVDKSKTIGWISEFIKRYIKSVNTESIVS